MITTLDKFPFGGKDEPKKEAREETEAKDPKVLEVQTWRRDFFVQVLSKNVSEDVIESLVNSTVSPHDVIKLRNMECPDHLIAKILV